MAKKVLNLLMMDEDQRYAEHLIKMLRYYFDEVNLGFWDEKSELIKALRHEWDVLVFKHAYEMEFADVVGVLQEHQVRIPLINLSEPTQAVMTEEGMPEVLDGDMIQSLVVGNDKMVVMAICLQYAYSQSQRHRNRLNKILKEAEQRANILIKNSKSAVAYIDQGVHIFANDPYLELFGYESMEDIIGVPVVDLIASGGDVNNVKQFLRRFDKGDRSQVELAFESRHTDGTTFASKLQLAAATLEGEPVTQIIIQRNDADSEELARKLAEAERQDALTGLINRIGFTEQLTKVHQQVLAGQTKAALLYISMDDIGKINSSSGLQGVDIATKYMAHLINEHFADGIVARFSDSTFAVLLTEGLEAQIMAQAEALRVKSETLLIEVGNRTVTTTLSIGVVMLDSNSPDVQTILARAIDTVASIASDTDSQGNKVRLFDISEHASDDEDALAEYIQTAIVNNRLKLSYQPIYDINSDSSNLSEVYVTLPMSDGTEMTLDKFVQVAKKHNLADKLDRWVLINACKHLAQVRKENPSAHLLISLTSVTLSEGQLAHIVTQLAKAVGEHGVYPLVLQFNERDLVDYLAMAKRQFMALANVGCPVGIQNFGATAKSAEVLAHLTPNMARLARAYTKDLDRANNMETVQGLVVKAAEHRTDVLMPYIGDAQTMSLAWSIGARYLQGDYLQAPAANIIFTEAAAE
ncbi:MAG: EAL domain-containing protein [Moraxella sp.]|nr:EAL domain-containing protein [Moraxella sp.]